ncbi:MAG TPA: S-layer homology domain-containing protein [Clostridia bacterium]|nr:S-layer homology domain-containing protein [Clostridia bacterium]
MKKRIALLLSFLMILMSVVPAMAADESLTDVVAELGVSNMYKLQDVFVGYFTDTKLDALDTYMDTNYSELQVSLNTDGIDATVLKDLADDITAVSLTEGMESTSASAAIFDQKTAVIATLGSIVDRIVTARGETKTNTEYAYEIIVGDMLNEDAVVTYNTSTGNYSLDFSGYKTNSALEADLAEIMPATFGTGYSASMDSLEAFFEYILNSSDFDAYGADFRAAIDSYNGGAYYNAYTPSTGGGGATPPAEETPVVEDPVAEETTEDETVVTSEVENAATVTTNDEGTEEADIDDAAVAEAVESVLEEVASLLEAATGAAEEGAQVEEFVPTVNLNIENEGADVAVNLQVGTMDTLSESEVKLNIKTDSITYEIPSGMIATDNIVTDDGEALDDDFELSFSSREVELDTVIEQMGDGTDDGIELSEAVEGKSKIIELSLDIMSGGEKVGSIHEFNKPITVKVSLADVPDADPDKVGVYYIDDETGKPVFMGGKVVVVDGVKMLEFSTTHYSKYAVLEANVTYEDVENHWSKAYVESMGAKHIVKGYPDGAFMPEKAVTRAEFAKMVVSAMNYDAADYAGTFNDVAEGAWYADYVASAEVNGVISGYADGTFKPDRQITRLEMAAMLSKALNNKLTDTEGNVLSAFSDNEMIAQWGMNSAAKAVEAGLMNGMDGDFNPQGTTTRAQAATAVYRLYNK